MIFKILLLFYLFFFLALHICVFGFFQMLSLLYFAEMDQVELSHGNKILSNKERWEIYSALLERSNNGTLKKTTTREVSDLLSVPIQQVRRIWRRAKETSSSGGRCQCIPQKIGELWSQDNPT